MEIGNGKLKVMNETGFICYLVLVPHRDARLPIRAWGDSLFAAGMPGGSFPWVAPLALLKRPLADNELKLLARPLRQRISNEGGKAYNPLPAAHSSSLIPHSSFPRSLHGISLNIELSDDFFAPVAGAVSCRISPLMLGAAVSCEPPPNLPDPPQISFRAAALANMRFRFMPLHGNGEGFFSEWEIGPLRWLPKTV